MAPLLGLGAEQSWGKHFTTSLEWVGVFSSGKALGDPLNSKMSNAALYSVGITYKF